MYFLQASQERRVNETVQFVTALHSAVHALYSGQPDYTGIETSVVSLSKMLPKKFIRPGANNPTLRHPLGKPAQVMASSTSTNRSHYFIKLFYIPKTMCPLIVTKLHANSIENISIGGTSYKPGITPAEALTACRDGLEEMRATTNLIIRLR